MSGHLLPPELRAEQGLIRALGREVLRSFPPVEHAMCYGSAVMRQSTDGKYHSNLEETLKKIDYNKGTEMMDFIFTVETPLAWHNSNINNYKNGSHYSLLLRKIPQLRFLLDKSGVGMIFNPHVPIEIRDPMLRDAGVPEVINIKYGVVGMLITMHDLMNWSWMYISGRMQKPVTVLQSHPMVTLASNLNLHTAVFYALLKLPPVFTEFQLYKEIVSISYDGDVRMKFGAEDPQKIDKIVMGNLPYLRDLYSDILSFFLDGAFYDPKNELGVNPDATRQILEISNSDLTHIPVVTTRGALYAQICEMDPTHVVLTQPDTNRHRAMLAASLPAYMTMVHARSPKQPHAPFPPLRNIIHYEPKVYTFGANAMGTLLHQVSPYGEFDGASMLAEQELVHKGASAVAASQQAAIESMVRTIDDGAKSSAKEPIPSPLQPVLPPAPKAPKRTARSRSLNTQEAPAAAEPADAATAVKTDTTDAPETIDTTAKTEKAEAPQRRVKSLIKKEAMQTFKDKIVADNNAVVNSLKGTASFMASRDMTPQERRVLETDMRSHASKNTHVPSFYEPRPPASSSHRFDKIYTIAASDLLAIDRALPTPKQQILLASGIQPEDIALPQKPHSILLPTVVPIAIEQALPANTQVSLENFPKEIPKDKSVGVSWLELPVEQNAFFIPFSYAPRKTKPANQMTDAELAARASAAVLRQVGGHDPRAALPSTAAVPAIGDGSQATATTAGAAQVASTSAAKSGAVAPEAGIATAPDASSVSTISPAASKRSEKALSPEMLKLLDHIRRKYPAPVAVADAVPLRRRLPEEEDKYVCNVPREQLLKDPCVADRAAFPAVHCNVEKYLDLNRLRMAKALPEPLLVPKLESFRQRWQVDSGYTKEQIDEEIAALGREPTESELKALHSPFINVQPAIYDPRWHFGGVARFENAVRTAQILITTRFPLYGASIVRHSEKQSGSLWKHNFAESSKTQRLLKSKIFTDPKGIKHVGQLTKNFEFVFLSAEWEGILRSFGTSKVVSMVRDQARFFVGRSSWLQTRNSVLSAGLKSFKYLFNKLKKSGRFK